MLFVGLSDVKQALKQKLITVIFNRGRSRGRDRGVGEFQSPPEFLEVDKNNVTKRYHDGDGSENINYKVNSRSFKLRLDCSNSLVGEFVQPWCLQ